MGSTVLFFPFRWFVGAGGSWSLVVVFGGAFGSASGFFGGDGDVIVGLVRVAEHDI